MVVVKALGRVLVPYCADSVRFIEACDSDPAQLKLTQKERYAIHCLVSLFQNTRVDGLKSSVWEKIDVFFPCIGGTSFKCRLNLKNPEDTDAVGRLVFLSQDLVGQIDNEAAIASAFGIRGSRKGRVTYSGFILSRKCNRFYL